MQDVRRLPVEGNDEVTATLDELAREGARRMIAAALEVEVEDYLASFVDDVVRNGHARERKLTVGSGTMAIRAPRVNDKRVDEAGERQRYSSRILPGVRQALAEGQRRAARALPARLVDR